MARQTWILLCIRVLQILLAIISQSVECHAIHPARHSTAWFVSTRGGDDTIISGAGTTTSTVHSIVAVLQLGDDAIAPLWLMGDDSTTTGTGSYSALFLGSQNPTPSYRIPKLPQDDNLVRSLGLLSDVIILCLPHDKNRHDLELMSQTLSQMAQERIHRQITIKPHLIVVSDSAKDSWWVQELVQNQLQSIVPSFWQSFDILTPQQLEIQWKKGDFIQNDGIIKSLLLPYHDNVPAASQLLKQLYMGMTESSVVLVDSNEGWFELQSVVPTESNMDPSISEQNSSVQVNVDNNDNENDDDDPQDHIQRVLFTAQQDLATLEAKVQQVQLETSSSHAMPLLDFGTLANAILDRTYQDLESVPPMMRIHLLRRLVLEIHQLYKDQLQSLRDYYGRRYEMVLDQHNNNNDNENDDANNKEAVWVKEAEHVTQAFQAASQHAIPLLCRNNGPLASIVTFDAIPSLQGLIQDMMEATQLRKDEHSLAFEEDEDDDDDDNVSPKKPPRVPRWVKKLASRAIALGINYVQGWLAWQGVKRAALERDREMPKFPLF